jgi:hypothetical protein
MSLDALRLKLAELRARDPERAVFGASSHGYALTPWTGAEVAAFEARHRVTLSPDHRAFLTEIGAEGAGPGYGLVTPEPLALDRFPRTVARITTKDGSFFESGTPARPPFGRAASIERPFPLAAAFCPSFVYDLPALASGVTPYDGCIKLIDHGCGYFDFLVVNGPGAGQVWTDTMAAMTDGSIVPSGRSLTGWYEAWLDASLASLPSTPAA